MLSTPAAGLLLILAWIYPAYALYFHIGETEKKCFIEEIPDETMVIGKTLRARQLRTANQQCTLTAGCKRDAALSMAELMIVMHRVHRVQAAFKS